VHVYSKNLQYQTLIAGGNPRPKVSTNKPPKKVQEITPIKKKKYQKISSLNSVMVSILTMYQLQNKN
jgi:hypothetical protein